VWIFRFGYEHALATGGSGGYSLFP
jgi:hypothetical protein